MALFTQSDINEIYGVEFSTTISYTPRGGALVNIPAILDPEIYSVVDDLVEGERVIRVKASDVPSPGIGDILVVQGRKARVAGMKTLHDGLEHELQIDLGVTSP